ncbi:hypothetical protein TNCV_1535881 [Trichonephila clavipes]|nr:hypothetical protein TNCV_1535881 [Trichonephila clavipes]
MDLIDAFPEHFSTTVVPVTLPEKLDALEYAARQGQLRAGIIYYEPNAKHFTFGLRTMKSREIHFIQTTHLSMFIYGLPSSNLKCRAQPMCLGGVLTLITKYSTIERSCNPTRRIRSRLEQTILC